jgi:hypothetical protein
LIHELARRGLALGGIGFVVAAQQHELAPAEQPAGRVDLVDRDGQPAGDALPGLRGAAGQRRHEADLDRLLGRGGRRADEERKNDTATAGEPTAGAVEHFGKDGHELSPGARQPTILANLGAAVICPGTAGRPRAPALTWCLILDGGDDLLEQLICRAHDRGIIVDACCDDDRHVEIGNEEQALPAVAEAGAPSNLPPCRSTLPAHH